MLSNLDKLINIELYQNTLSEAEEKETCQNFCKFFELLNKIAEANPQVISQENVNDVLYENNGSKN
jgi:hypothetical protein